MECREAERENTSDYNVQRFRNLQSSKNQEKEHLESIRFWRKKRLLHRLTIFAKFFGTSEETEFAARIIELELFSGEASVKKRP